MAATDERDDDHLPGRARRRAGRAGAAGGDDAGPDASDDELEAVTRLMGFLRSDET